MVVSTLRPAESAHIDAPLPRCATIVRPLAASGGNGLPGPHDRGERRCRNKRTCGQLRPAREQRTDRCQVVRLVQGSKRDIALEIGQHPDVDQHRPIVFGAAVDHPMPDGNQTHALRFTQPVACGQRSGRKVGNVVRLIDPVDQGRAVRTRRPQARAGADAVELAFDQRFELVRLPDCEHLELQARGAGVDDEHRFHGDYAGSAVLLRRATA
jgi:hypothetical protein